MKQLINSFIKYPSWANVFMLFTLIIGLLGLTQLKRSFFPEPRIKDIYVEVVNPGTSPIEMEESVTIKIENALKGIAGIEEVNSTTSENYTNIHISSEKGYDIDEVLSDVKNAVDQISSFPENAEKPKVYKRKPIGTAIHLNLYGTVSVLELKKAAEIIEDDFLATDFISQINIQGVPEQEIVVNVNEQTLTKYGLTISDISQRIAQENRDISSGSIKTSNEELLIRSEKKSTNPNELQKIVIKSSASGGIVYLGDIAEVYLQLAESAASSTFNGMPSIGINVKKLPEEDIIKITEHVKEYIKAFNEQNTNIQLSVQRDPSIMLNQRIDLLVENGAKGLLLVVIVLGIFLNGRLAFWVAVGIPVSFLGMLFIASLLDVTINQISLFGMIMVIGILVDDGIVIAENIYSHAEKGGPPRLAALNGTMQVLPSVFVSVMTTIIAFSSFFFLDGPVGDILVEMGVVVIACLFYSLLEATALLPAHLRDLKHTTNPNRFRKFINRNVDYVRKRIYGRFVLFTIRYRWQLFTFPLGFSFLMLSLIIGGIIPSSFLPNIDSDDLTVAIEMPAGTRESVTNKYLSRVDSAVWVVNKSYQKELNGKDIILATRLDIKGQGNAGNLLIKLLDGPSRNDIESTEISNKIQEIIGDLPETEKFIISGRSYFGKPVSFILISKDLNELNGAKRELELALKQFPELRDVVDNNELGKREIKLQLKEKAYLLGLTSQFIAQQLRQGFFGLETQRLQIGTNETKVWVRLPESDRAYLSQLDNFLIRTANGGEYPLATIADYTIKREFLNIKHYNGAREITVEASLKDPSTPTQELSAQIKNEILPVILQKYPTVRLQKGGQERVFGKLLGSIQILVPVIIIIIYLLLVLSFRSFLQPSIILLMIPLGLLGSLIGHLLHNIDIVIMSYMGMVALAGVIVNDAVVFLDRYNENLKNGLKVGRAIYEAGISRFRPILLTSITTVAGLYPIIFEKSRQAQFLIPMAITVAWGVLIGTLFILILFPSFIMMLNDVRYVIKWVWTGKKPTREEIEPSYKELVDEENNSF